MKEFWAKYSVEKEFLRYFPQTFLLRVPPADYFWRVFSVVKKNEYEKLLKEKLTQMKNLNRIKNEKLTLTPEAIRILKNTDFEGNLSLLRWVISCEKRRSEEDHQPVEHDTASSEDTSAAASRDRELSEEAREQRSAERR